MRQWRIAASLLLVMVCASGCVLVPETQIDLRPPAGATRDLQSAMAYADSVAAGISSLQVQESATQAGLNLSALTVATMGMSRVVYQRPVEALRPIVVGLAALTGLEVMTAPKANQLILDQGALALTCATHLAKAMDEIPVAVSGASSSQSPIVPASPFSRLSTIPREGANAALLRSAQLTRNYARALNRAGAISPAAPGSRYPAPLAGLAALANQNADSQVRAASALEAQAQAAKAKAPEYLVFNTQLVARTVLAALHGRQATTGDLVSTVQKSGSDQLKAFHDALDAAQKLTQTATTTLSATQSVASAATSPMWAPPAIYRFPPAVDRDQPPPDPDSVPDGSAKPAGKNPGAGKERGQPDNSAAEAASAARQQTQTAADAEQSGDSASAAAQHADDLLAQIKAVADAAAQCQATRQEGK